MYNLDYYTDYISLEIGEETRKIELKDNALIHFKMDELYSIQLNIQQKNTILDIKEKIKEEINFPISSQKLFYKDNYKNIIVLNDDYKTLLDYYKDLKNENFFNELQISLKGNMKININNTEEKKIETIYISTSSTFSDLFEILEAKMGASDDSLLSFNNKYYGKNSGSLIVKDIYNNIYLEFLKKPPFYINIKDLKGRNLKLLCEPTDNIGTIKIKISNEIEMPAEDQRLIFAGRQLEDNRTLKDYNIQIPNVTFHLFRRLR